MLVERCNGHSWIHCCWQKGVKRRECWTVEHQPNLTLRRGDSIAHVWMDALNQETMDLYFSLLEEVLMKHNLVDKPSQICNVDESGVPLDPKPPNVITKKGGLISSFSSLVVGALSSVCSFSSSFASAAGWSQHTLSGWINSDSIIVMCSIRAPSSHSTLLA